MIQPIPAEPSDPPWPPTAFAGLIAVHRELKGWSINKLARAVGVDPAYAYRWEKGEQVPLRPIVLKIIAALDLSVAAGDRLLYAAGHAPVLDWQTLAERAVADGYAAGRRTLEEAATDAEI